jgi:hypothetical protein
MITLLHAFGNSEKVTDTLLTSHYVDLLKKTNLKDEKKCHILAIIAFICMTTFKPTTIEHMVIGDLTFKFKQIQFKLLQFQQDVKQQDRSKKKLSQVRISCVVKMKKDKHLLEKDHNVPMQSNNDLNIDFLMIFMIYLWDIRRIGTQSSLTAALLSQDLFIQEKYLNTPLFVQNQVTNQCINDFWYLLVSFGRKKGCFIHLTFRSCKAHIPTQGCLTFIYLYKQPPSLDLLILFLEYGNWETFASMKLYKKTAIRLALSAGNYQFVTQRVSDLGEEELFEHKERMLTNSWVFISKPVVASALFTTISE